MTPTTARHIATAERHFRDGRFETAERLLRQTLDRDPETARAYELLAFIDGNRGQWQASEELLLRATSLPGVSAEAFYYLARIQLQQGLALEARASLDRSLQMAGPYFEGLHELGVALSALGEHDAALASFRAAERLAGDSAELQFNIGRTLDELRSFQAALEHYDRALLLQPEAGIVWSNRGVTLSELGQGELALQSFERALALLPDDVPTLLNQARTLSDLHRPAEAVGCYDRVLALAPETDYVLGNRLFAKLQACDWSGLSKDLDQVIAAVDAGRKASPPFALCATPAGPASLLACARTYANDLFPAQVVPTFAVRDDHARIRIGYFSADFHDHATSQLMVGLLEHHDRERFETFAFSFGPPRADGMRMRVAAAMDHFIDVGGRSDSEIATLSRDAGVDIAVDLKGYTYGARPGILARHAAPLQLSYLGFPGSMACAHIDYVIADDTVVGSSDAAHYAEKLIWLPDCYQPNDRRKQVAGLVPGRIDLGLPEQGFVFCCFNSHYKITPDVFDVWMRLLQQVPDSVLWLMQGTADARARLQAEALARGVEPARLVWAPRTELEHHLARHAQADLFLDTFHYNAHTTGSDALWAGLPLLTLAGPTFASRVAASLLKAVGLPELITHRVPDYEALALSLARSPEALALLRQRLQARLPQCPLFDTPRIARRLELAYEAIWERHRSGLPPDHIRVTDDAEAGDERTAVAD